LNKNVQQKHWYLQFSPTADTVYAMLGYYFLSSVLNNQGMKNSAMQWQKSTRINYYCYYYYYYFLSVTALWRCWYLYR